jgi:hypothetical protein
VTTNAWLAVIAAATVLQLGCTLAVLIGAWRFYDRADRALEELQENVRDVVHRVRTADEAVRNAVRKTSETAALLATFTRRRAWPVIGLARAARMAAATLFRSRKPSPPASRPLAVRSTDGVA